MCKDFVHLHLHSQYSLLDGAIKFDELFDEVGKQGMSSVALTDHGNLFGAYDFYKKAKDKGVKPIVGCEIYIAKDHTNKSSENNKTHHLTVLAQNLELFIDDKGSRECTQCCFIFICFSLLHSMGMENVQELPPNI